MMKLSVFQGAARVFLAAVACLPIGLAPALSHPVPSSHGFVARWSAPAWQGSPARNHAWRGWDRGAPWAGGRNRGPKAWVGNRDFGPGIGFSGGTIWGPHGVSLASAASPVVFAPSLSFVQPASQERVADQGPAGECVIHQLQYDQARKYIGERQYSEC